MRIPPTADATTATIDQVRRLVGLLGNDGDAPMFVFDAGYDLTLRGKARLLAADTALTWGNVLLASLTLRICSGKTMLAFRPGARESGRHGPDPHPSRRWQPDFAGSATYSPGLTMMAGAPKADRPAAARAIANRALSQVNDLRFKDFDSGCGHKS